MASSRQIQVMKLRVREKLDDILSQQKTIIASINTMSYQVKKRADGVLKSVGNDVTMSDFVDVLQDLERCFINLIVISTSTDELFSLTTTTNSFCRNNNSLVPDSFLDYQVQLSNEKIPEFHPLPSVESYKKTQSNDGTSSVYRSPSDADSIGRQPATCDTQNDSNRSGTIDQYLSDLNDSLNISSSQTASLCEQFASVEVIDSQADSVFTADQMESVHSQQHWTNLDSDFDLDSMSDSTNLSSPVKDISSIPNIVSAAPFCPKSLSVEETYGLGPELKYQKVVSITNVQVCETITPYCFWVQFSNTVHLLQELTSAIYLFIASSNYNLKTVYGMTCPLVGMTCIAPFTDGTYYRARVLSVLETQNPDHTLASKVNVLYVDYGNMDIIPTSSLVKMPKAFAKLPALAVCCALAKVMPNDIAEDWSTDSSEAFHNMVFCKELVCNPVCGDTFIPQIIDLYLLESPSQMTLKDLRKRQESKVSCILIKQGFAKSVAESSQVGTIYQIVKDWILFKSNSSSVKGNKVKKIIKSPPGLSKPMIKQHQANDDLELHHQSFQMHKDSTCLDFPVPIFAQMASTSPEGTQLNPAFPASCSKLPMLDSDNVGNSLFSSSDTILNQSLLQDSTTLSPQLTVLKENCISDLKNILVTLNLQPVVSKSENYPVTAVETTITSSANNIDSGLSSSMETPPSGLLANLPKQEGQTNSGKNSVSSDYESVDSKSDTDEFNAVIISHVESPSSFYVCHINKESRLLLERLIHDLKTEFCHLTPCQLTLRSNELTVEKGELCCVYYADEEACYRGLIIEHKTDISMGVLVKVFYVDFGNSEWFNCDKVYRLPEPYSTIPALAQHCTLAYVQPQGTVVWPEKAKTAFKNMLKVNETYFTKIVAGSLTFDTPSLENYQQAPVEVLMMICDGSSGSLSDNEPNGKTEICLNYELIDLKHARINVDKSKNMGLIEWDPMLEDFDSRRNCYDVNIDDAEIAAVGFKVKDELKICKFFRDGRRCWLGKRCPYKHIHLEKDCFTADKREAVCDVGLLGQMELPQVGSLVGVEVSAVSSPVQFYVIFPWGIESVKNLNSMPVCPNKEETLPDLQESLQKFYKKLPPRAEENLLWSIGELVVAQASADEQWYRARISDVSDVSNSVKVFFVDYGNIQWIPEKHIQPIQPQFVHLPYQAVECCLNGIASTTANGLWTQEARDYFVELVDDVVLVGHVNSIISSRLYIDLYNTSNEEDENIADDLVRVGVACKLETKAEPSKKSKVNNNDTAASTSHVLLMPG